MSKKDQRVKKLLKSNLNNKTAKAELYSLINPKKLVSEYYCELWGTRSNPGNREAGTDYWRNGKQVKPKSKKGAVSIDNVKNVRVLAERYLKSK